MIFTEDDVKEISHCIGLIYDTVVNDALWPRVLEAVCQLVGAKASRIYWRDASDPNSQTFYAWGFDPWFLEVYTERFLTLNPLYPASIFVNPGEIFSSRDLVSPEEFQSSRFFKEWVAPQGFFDAAIFNIQRYRASAAAFTVITGTEYGHVDDRLRFRLSLLAPHLQRAALISREISGLRQRASSIEAAFNQVKAGVFLLDASGQPVWTNEAAAALIARGDLVRVGASGFGLVPHEADQRLRDGLVVPAKTEAVLNPSPALIKMTDGEGVDWFGCLMRLAPLSETRAVFEQVGRSAQAALFVRRVEPVPASGVEITAKLYGLTPAEIRVLHTALQFDAVAKMADALGVSANTVKKHLAAIFAKMGVSKRTALIRMVMSAQP